MFSDHSVSHSRVAGTVPSNIFKAETMLESDNNNKESDERISETDDCDDENDQTSSKVRIMDERQLKAMRQIFFPEGFSSFQLLHSCSSWSCCHQEPSRCKVRMES